MSMEFIRKLPLPQEIKKEYPLSVAFELVKQRRDEEVRKIFTGESDKLLFIIGPCSADREDAVMEYISRLAVIQEQVRDKIMILPRIYTNKPRTNGTGYKGMVHQPDPSKGEDMLEGLLSIRKLHRRAIEETGFTCADEMLYPENYRYLSDLLSYVAVGARSVEDQQHRLTVSGMDIPAGMKNPTSGDLNVMFNSIYAAQSGHTFLYRGWEVRTTGNPLAHAILRGFVNKHGESQPNYHYEDLLLTHRYYTEKQLVHPAVIVDTNHANSGKQYLEQPRIVSEVLHCCRHNSDIRHMVKGFMVESYLVDGCQKISEGVYGKSITDPCLGWEKTEELLLRTADLLV
ncbi:MAG: 3-deoxy-7-phosphoheptulonate synthase [Oscillospiraceae bacterium]|nr:3-deoxy-7-phosphoheptulonate synthase [Oscillospiraceae bacterium]